MPGTDFFKKRTFLKKDVFFLWNLQGSYFQQNTENLLITKEEYLLIIQSSDVGMSSKRTYARSESHVISFSGKKSSVFGIGDKNGSGLVTTLPDSSQEKEGEKGGKQFSNSLDELIERLNVGKTDRSSGSTGNGENASRRKIRYFSMDYIWQLLFGRRFELTDLTSSLGMSGNFSGGFSGNFSEEYCYHEEESTTFETTGTVKTSDGREINFQLELSMSRSFTEVYSRSFSFGGGMFTDPLVINMDCDAADVCDQKFYFDLDADGHEEAISRLGPGSGFLALDKNGDGKINDGTELFGTRSGNGTELFGTSSGNGFADLARYDSDKNGWIDEADDVFKDLMIWSKDRNGNDKLIGLGAAGIGAIYLGNCQSEFALNRLIDNEPNARIRSTGIFLYENGSMGTLQQLDLAQ